ncbi:MAG: FG-GAP-like repeat-containing protein [Thermoanaerobaculia bacterium]|nr:FG-GAP-like repeat-containing protein [Thermoanaerobaculia bacterium]
MKQRLDGYRSHRSCSLALAPIAGLTCLALGWPAAPTVASEIPFAPLHQVNLGGFDGVISIRAGDIDSDGNLDLVAVSPTEGRVLWFKNELGDGSQWAERCVVDAFPGAFTVAVDDVDNDGDLDVVAGSATTGVVAWWDNLTGPGCGTQHAVTTVAATFVRSVATADADSDGDVDVMTLSDAELRISHNSGDGVFSSDLTIAGAADISGGASIFAADVDGDHDVDIVVAERGAGRVSWWRNDDTLGTTWTEMTASSTVPDVRTVTAADLDDDGDLDLIAAAESPDIVWFQNLAGDGSAWSSAQEIESSFGTPRSVVAADLDQDGDLDIVSTEELNGGVSWWEQLRDGPGITTWVRHSLTTLLDGGGRTAVVADLDGDGDPDLAGAAPDADFIAWWQNETIHRSALFGPSAVDVATAFGTPSAATAGDVDGDGALDVASVASATNELAWWRNDVADGSTWSKTTIGTFAGDELLLGDVDLDGDLDVVAPDGTSGFEIHWWQNDSGGGDTWTQRLLHLGVTTGFHSLADIDGDGALDLVAYNIFQGDVMWLRNPRNIFDWAIFLVEGQSSDALATGDLDGDGDQDIVGKLSSDPLVWWENTQDFGLDWSRIEIDDNDPMILDEPHLTVADLDQDGDADVVAIDNVSGSLYWWQNKPPSGETWLRRQILGSLPGAREVLTADLDQDGDLDILGRGPGAGSIVWWQNLGDGQFWQQESAVAIGAPESIAVADLDDDGDLDVLASAASEDRILWYPNLGGQLGLPSFDTAPSTIQEEAIEDVLEIEARHLGRSGDSSQELATVTVLLEESAGDPLNTVEAEVLFDSLSIWLDDGSGTFEPADDMMVLETSSFDLEAGEQVLTLVDGDPAVEVGAGQARIYFLAVTGAVGASQQTPNTFRVTLQLAAGTAEDASSDLPTDLEETTTTPSSTITLVAPCRILALSHTGSGSPPVADPPSSVACPAGSFNAGEIVTLTAAPDTGWIVTGWTGSDDDGSTETSNLVTIPDVDHAVTVHYAFPLFSDGFESGDTSLWSTTAP